jgi:hypothetical protein
MGTGSRRTIPSVNFISMMSFGDWLWPSRRRYGMPYRVRTEGDTGSATVLDVEHHNLGLFGLGAILIGTVFQIIGAIVPD